VAGEVEDVRDLHGDLTAYLLVRGELGLQRREHLGGGVDRRDVVAGPGEAQGLGALAGAHVEHGQRPLGQQLAQRVGQLGGDEVLAHDVAQVAQPGQPQVTAGLEAAGARDGRGAAGGHPRPARRRPERTRGGGSRKRRICMLRISA
jgi:hypothetical protein